MATATLKKQPRVVGPDANGMLMTPREFDRAEFEDGWVYELINGVLIVSPIPSPGESDPNEELGFLLRYYQKFHPDGKALDLTLAEQMVHTRKGRRRADRLIWAGLDRVPRVTETPTIVVEFPSGRQRDRQRDYKTKRDEFMAVRVKEYWIIDRFDRCLTVFTRQGGKVAKRVIREGQVYRTPLLPGFELVVADLLAVADRWKGPETPKRQ